MKYCTHCGAELLEDAVICPKCGCWVNSEGTTSMQQKAKLNACALVGFILSLVGVVLFFVDYMGLLALAGMILSIVALVQLGKNNEQRGKAFAITGVSVGACMFVFGVIYWISVMLP